MGRKNWVVLEHSARVGDERERWSCSWEGLRWKLADCFSFKAGGCNAPRGREREGGAAIADACGASSEEEDGGLPTPFLPAWVLVAGNGCRWTSALCSN